MCGGKVAIPPIVKEKRRNSEKRKEKSRDAARCRRSRESEIFADLSRELPVPDAVTHALDKASVMRLTLACLRVRDMITVLGPKELSSTPLDKCYPEALNGFLLVLSDEGDVLFISDKVEQILGTHYADMLGQSLFDYLHPCDCDELRSLLSAHDDVTTTALSLFLRMKSALLRNKRPLHLKAAAPYQVIHCVGHKFRKPPLADEVEEGAAEGGSRRSFYLLFIGTPIPHPAHVDLPLSGRDCFVTRHTPDMKFTHCDDKISDFVGFESSDLIGKSVYNFHHALDAEAMLASYKTLLQKGQVESGCYRFVCKHGGHAWLLTQATLICDAASHRPEAVVCLNYVLSKVEHEEEIVSEQQEPPKVEEAAAALSNTCGIFRRKDMSKQFLNFPDADILLFHEPLKSDSKLHLELDLFPDDGIEDPFSYREDSLSSPSYCGTPESTMHLPLSSPDRFSSSRSPDTPDSGSLSDIPSLDPIDTFSNLRFSIPPSADKEDCYEEDLDFRAPFIPMQMDDDFPLLSPSNSVMWGPPQENPPRRNTAAHTDRLCEPPEPRAFKPPLNENALQSSLAALLQSDTKKAANSRHNDRNNRRFGHNDNGRRQHRNHPAPHNARNNSNGGHIIMLDSAPRKQAQPKPAPSSGQRRSAPSIGSHTSTVRVNDRLIKVQVSVSELPSALPIEQKQPFPTPPDPPPKRAPAPHTDSPKRIKVDNNPFAQGSSDSVLLNLLISGEDASRGYLCSGNSRYAENKRECEPAVLSLPSSSLLEGGDLLDSYLKLQYDELLDDHPLLLRPPATA